MEVTDMCF